MSKSLFDTKISSASGKKVLFDGGTLLPPTDFSMNTKAFTRNIKDPFSNTYYSPSINVTENGLDQLSTELGDNFASLAPRLHALHEEMKAIRDYRKTMHLLGVEDEQGFI